MSDKHGTIAWTELMTRDLEGAKAYYGKVCGWDFQTMPMEGGPDYTLVMKGDQPMLGLFDVTKTDGWQNESATWVTYFEVDDVDAAVAQTREAGGKVTREPFDVPNVGRIATVEDPTGAELGLMTSAQQD